MVCLTPVTDATAVANRLDHAVCYTPGTLIATPRGEMPVEGLRAGDRVLTRDNGVQEIRWAGQRQIAAADFATDAALTPVVIRKGALGHGLPERDMRISPSHRMLITSQLGLSIDDREVLVAARDLTGTAGIERAAGDATYCHFLFDHHEIVLADGCWSESFQPDAATMAGLGIAQQAEIHQLFPALAGYGPARQTLKLASAISLS